MDRLAVGHEIDRGYRYAEGCRCRIEESCAELGALHALVARLRMRQLLVLGRKLSGQVGRRVRECRLLTDEQSQGQQDVRQGALEQHSAGIFAIVSARKCARSCSMKSSPERG